jgi:hypothetical protein
MKRSPVIFLQVVIVLIGIGAFVLLLWEPRIEGVNAHATTLYQIYFDDPFLMLVYAGSIPFFIALYQAVKVLEYVGQNKIFSQAAVKALKNIKYCALTIISFVAVEEIFIMLTHGSDDATGGIFVGALVAFGSLVSVAAAATLGRILQAGMDRRN